MKGFLTVVVLLVSTYLAFDVSASQTIRISFKNDPQYPNLLSVSNLTYNWADFRQIVEINADITLSKTLIKGTKVNTITTTTNMCLMAIVSLFSGHLGQGKLRSAATNGRF